MLSREIERRLRLPAPDEPAVLPALILPTARQAGEGVRLRRRDGRYPTRIGFGDLRLVFAVLALLTVMISAIAIGALRLDRLPNPFDSNGHFGARGVTLDYPKNWHVVAELSSFNDQGGWTTLILSNTGVDGCSSDQVGAETIPPPVPSGDNVVDGGNQTGAINAVEDRIFACVMGKPLAEGEIRLVLMRGYPQRIGIGPIEPFDAVAWFGREAPAGGGAFVLPSEADGWTTTIDGMPAKLVVETTSIAPGAEEVRTWGVFGPEAFGDLWFVRATMRGPDLEALRAQSDMIAFSLKFDSHPPVLDEATRDVALSRAIDDLDRETRATRGSDFYGCFPRSPGAQAALIDDRLYEYGPDGPLAEPVPVTCTTTVEPTKVGMWHATLVVSWAAGDGYEAGEWGWELYFPADGGGGAQGQMAAPDALRWPGTVGELPPPLTEPLVIPIGSIVEVLPPGVDQSGPVIQAVWQSSDAPDLHDHIAIDARPGYRYHVIDGPISVAGFEWYLVEWQHGTSFGAEYVWLPATDGVRPLIRIVDPTCPSTARGISDLLALLPAERVLCFGDRDLTLGPTIVSLVEENPGGEVEGSPAWLAKDPLWRLYGSGGPDGLDGSLVFAIDPSLGETVPTGTWLTVHGHFDDPASTTCVRTFPDGWGGIPEAPDMQRWRCRELFVITSFETRSAP